MSIPFLSVCNHDNMHVEAVSFDEMLLSVSGLFIFDNYYNFIELRRYILHRMCGKHFCKEYN